MNTFMVAVAFAATPVVASPSTIPRMIAAEFGAYAPIMQEIARCESTLRQHNDIGGPIENPVTHDIGLFQINPIHFNEFAKLGISIYTVEGNIKAARVLFDQSHLGPWRSSLKCWGPALDGDLAIAE